MRFEYGSDPWINAPDNPVWVHAGHAIVIDSHTMKGNTSSGKGGGEATSSETKTDSQIVRAYKFGDRPAPQSSGKYFGGLLARHNSKGSKQERQHDHDIHSYIKAIELAAKTDHLWPKHFVGEDGTEKKRMV